MAYLISLYLTYLGDLDGSVHETVGNIDQLGKWLIEEPYALIGHVRFE